MELDTRKKKDPVHASNLWLRKNHVIDDADMLTISDIREHRNFVAHEMTKVLGSSGVEVNLELLDNLIEVLGKIDRWWITEVEIPTSQDLAPEDYDTIHYDAVFSMRMMVLQLISRVAYGDDESLAALYKEFESKVRRAGQ